MILFFLYYVSTIGFGSFQVIKYKTIYQLILIIYF